MQAPPTTAANPPLLISVRVVPRAHHEDIAREGEGLRVRVTAPPVEGAANDAVIALLARSLKLPKGSVALVRGASARTKTIAVQGISANEVWARLGL